MTATIVTVKVVKLDEADLAALYCHYQGQTKVQSCFVALSLEDGELWASYNPEIGTGIPESVWAGRTRRWTIPVLTAAAANTLLEELAPQAQRVLDGAEVVWNGNNNVGELSADARDAEDEIVAVCQALFDEPASTVGEYDAGDWFAVDAGIDQTGRYVSSEEAAAHELGITAETGDTQLAEIAVRLERETLAWQEPAVLLGVTEYLTRVRDELRGTED